MMRPGGSASHEGILLYFFPYPEAENSAKSYKAKSFLSQKNVSGNTEFPHAGLMNFQLTSRHRPFIFKAESGISEGVPAGKVFATWGVCGDWKLQVGPRTCTEYLEIRQGPKPSLLDEETGHLRALQDVIRYFRSKLEVGPTCTFPPHDTALCLLKCDAIRGGLSEIIVQILYTSESVKCFTAYSLSSLPGKILGQN